MADLRVKHTMKAIVQWAQTFGLGNWLYYGAFALCAFTTMVMRVTFYTVFFIPKSTFELVAYPLVACLLVIKILVCRNGTDKLLLALALVAIGVVSVWVVHAWRFSILFFFIAAGEGIQLRRLALIVLVLQISIMIVTLPAAFMGRIDSVYIHRLVDGKWVPRSSYGYSHPNMLGQSFLAIACSYAVVRFPRVHIVDVFVYGATILGAALLVGARTAAACTVLAALLALLAPVLVKTPARKRVMAWIALGSFVAMGTLSLLMMVLYNDNVSWMHSIDQMLSTRFSLAHRFWEVFPPTPFGREIMAVKTEEILQTAPDNAYVRTLIKQGIVPAIVLGALCLATGIYIVRYTIYDACVFGLIVFAIEGVMEMYATNFTLNYFLIACAWVLFTSWPALQPMPAVHMPNKEAL